MFLQGKSSFPHQTISLSEVTEAFALLSEIQALGSSDFVDWFGFFQSITHIFTIKFIPLQRQL